MITQKIVHSGMGKSVTMIIMHMEFLTLRDDDVEILENLISGNWKHNESILIDFIRNTTNCLKTTQSGFIFFANFLHISEEDPPNNLHILHR